LHTVVFRHYLIKDVLQKFTYECEKRLLNVYVEPFAKKYGWKTPPGKSAFDMLIDLCFNSIREVFSDSMKSLEDVVNASKKLDISYHEVCDRHLNDECFVARM
jgi:hypothetical protein